MPDAAVIGAGPIGCAIVDRLAARGTFGCIHLIDEPRAVSGLALDLQQAAPVRGVDARIEPSADVTDALDAAVILMADRLAPADPGGADAAADAAAAETLGRLAAWHAGLVFVCAGRGDARLVERAVNELGMSRHQVVGSSPAALAGAARALIALELDASPADVGLSVLGVPPDDLVIPWTSVTVGGTPIADLLAPVRLARLAARVPAHAPPGPLSLAAAAASAAEAIVRRSRRLLSCCVVMDGFGARSRAMALQARLGPRGVERVETPAVSAQERVRVENALRLA